MKKLILFLAILSCKEQIPIKNEVLSSNFVTVDGENESYVYKYSIISDDFNYWQQAKLDEINSEVHKLLAREMKKQNCEVWRDNSFIRETESTVNSSLGIPARVKIHALYNEELRDCH